MEEFVYIYNVEQANFYLNNGVIPVEMGVNDKTGRVYFKYTKHDSQPIYDKWLKICESIRKENTAK